MPDSTMPLPEDTTGKALLGMDNRRGERRRPKAQAKDAGQRCRPKVQAADTADTDWLAIEDSARSKDPRNPGVLQHLV